MKVEPDFLPLPIQDWESSEEFKRARDFVFHVKVTNEWPSGESVWLKIT